MNQETLNREVEMPLAFRQREMSLIETHYVGNHPSEVLENAKTLCASGLDGKSS
jgi:hypothetical protein